jgi:ribonuclease HI
MYDFIITVDGGSLGNGKEDSIGYGSYILDMPKSGIKTLPFELKFGTGITNNEAEYMALIEALKKVITVIEAPGNRVEESSIRIITDSQLVMKHLTREWPCKARNLLPLFQEALVLVSRFYRVTIDRISGDDMKLILGH